MYIRDVHCDAAFSIVIQK